MSLDELADNIDAVPRGDTSRGIALAKDADEKYQGKLNKKGIVIDSSKNREPEVPDVSSIMEAMQNGERARMGDEPSSSSQYGINNGYGALNQHAGSVGSISKDDDDDRDI